MNLLNRLRRNSLDLNSLDIFETLSPEELNKIKWNNSLSDVKLVSNSLSLKCLSNIMFFIKKTLNINTIFHKWKKRADSKNYRD